MVRIVDTPQKSAFHGLPERYREGILRLMAQWTIGKKSGVVEIVILDRKAQGVVQKTMFKERFLPPKLNAAEEIKLLPPKTKGPKEFFDFENKTIDEKIKLLKEHPDEYIWTRKEIADMVKLIRDNGGVAYLKSQGLKKLTVFRIQSHTRGLAYRPVIFIGHLLSYVGVDNPTTAKRMIGYSKTESEKTWSTNEVMIWEIDINEVKDASWDNARWAFEEYKKWGQQWYALSKMDDNIIPDHLNKALGSNPGSLSYTLSALKKWMRNAVKYGFLNSDFSDKLTKKEWDAAWKARKARLPKDGLFEDLRKEAESKGLLEDDYAKKMPEYGLGLLAGDIGFFDLFSGNGMGWTYTNEEGGMEWLMILNDPTSFQNANLPNLKIEKLETSFKK